MRRGHGSARVAVPALLVCGALVLGLCAAGSPRSGTVQAYFPLDMATVAVGPTGPVPVFAGTALVPGTRVLAHEVGSEAQAQAQRRWLAAGTVPEVPELGDSTMVGDALLDLHVLSTQSGVPVAGWSGPWRYVWPRDSALAAAALARTGHLADAVRVIAFLQRVQPVSGAFEARYRPDGTSVGDQRGPQTDSLGWALWAMLQVCQALPVDERRAFVEHHRPLLERSVRASLALIDNPQSLPAPSSDYWEMKEQKLTLSTAALLRAGLVSAGRLYAILGRVQRSAQISAAATRLALAIDQGFAADGYPRHLGGSSSSVDLGVSYLLPPFVSMKLVSMKLVSMTRMPMGGPVQVWRASATKMARPAGGLAPGGSWREDGVSWTTATSSYAMTAALVGDRSDAVERLRWLDDHRTSLGSLPEKVLADGQPASVAPLAWAAAAVIITASRLSEPQAERR